MKRRDPRVIEEAGNRYGRLVAIDWSEGRWNCRCDCGASVRIKGQGLRTGDYKSCGCLHREMDQKLAVKRTIHGMSRKNLPEYNAWVRMRARCANPANKHFKNYGGRGIAVCERWAEFANFYADMGPRPGRGHSIDRRDNDGNYELGNCRWATRKVQQNNMRTNRTIEFEGRTETAGTLAERFGLTRDIVYARIFVRGWSVERAIAS